MFVFADKTRNIYKTSLDTYNKLLHDNVTKTYKRGFEGNISEINNELKHIANKLSIGSQIKCMKKREAFISLKDHKENFENNPKCRLFDSAKSDSGKISKLILDKLNTHLRSFLNVNQKRNTKNVMEWFGNIKEKTRHCSFCLTLSIFTRQFLKIYWTKHYLGPLIWLTFRTKTFL